MLDDENTGIIENKKKIIKKWGIGALSFICILFVFIYCFLSAPLKSKDIVIHISSGQSINNITQKLEEENVIRKDYILKVFIKLLKSGKGIIVGDYLIKKDTPVWTVAWQISRGHHGIEPVKVTIKEGMNNDEIGKLFADKISSFRKDLFVSSAYNKQGYLFPDTYFFFPLDTTEELVKKLLDNFDSKIKSISPQIDASGKSLNEIITMASILEREAGGPEDIYMISGVLWKRLSIGMRLQVDVDRTTYGNTGLPDAPINNPGLLSIKAAINPVSSPYLYYLHDKNGKVHFAKTLDEHNHNIATYLK